MFAFGMAATSYAQESDGLAPLAVFEHVLVDAIAKAEQSVVSITRIKRTPLQMAVEDLPGGANVFRNNVEKGLERDEPTNPDFIPTDFGSGVVIGVDPPSAVPRRTYILTNYHVVRGGTRTVPIESTPDEFKLYVRVPSRRMYVATIFAADPRSDLAVLVIDDADVKPIKLGDGSKLRKGNFVIGLGNPYAAARDGSASASLGIISNIRRRTGVPRPRPDDQKRTLHDLGDLIQVDLRLNLGTSGGALINLKGELVGLTTSLAALAGFEKSAGFAVPIDVSNLRVIQTLREGKEVEHGFLGVSFATDDRPTSLNLMKPHPEGAVVDDLVSGGPAERAGLRKDDIILNVNGERTFNQDDLTREINKLGPESKARIAIWRFSEPSAAPVTIDVQLGKWGAFDEEGIVVSKQRFPPWRGLVIDYSTARDKHNDDLRNPSIRAYPAGVLVLKILPPLNSIQPDLAEGARILKVNQRPVSTPAEFYEVVKDLRGDVALEVRLGRDGMTGKETIKQVTLHE